MRIVDFIKRIKILATEASSKLHETGFYHIFGSSIVNKVISFLSGVILVRIITKEDFGIYSYANDILGFCTLITGFGAASGVLQLGCEEKQTEKRQSIYRYGCRLGLGFNLFLAFIILLIALFIPLPVAGSNSYLGLMCLLPLVEIFSALQIVYLRTELQNKKYAYSNTVSTLTIFVLSCGCAFILQAKGLILAHYLAGLISSAIIILVFKVPFSLKPHSLDRKTQKSFLYVSGISMVNNGLSRLMYLLDVFVLGIVTADGIAIASYKVATIIPTALAFIPGVVVTYVYPFFARHKEDIDWSRRNAKRLIGIMVFTNLCISTLLFFLAPLVIEIVFGKQYLDALIPFRILCVSYFFSGSTRAICGNLLVAQRRLKFNLVESIASSLINTGLNFWLINRYASIGAAIATLITMVFSSTLCSVYLFKVYNEVEIKNKTV